MWTEEMLDDWPKASKATGCKSKICWCLVCQQPVRAAGQQKRKPRDGKRKHWITKHLWLGGWFFGIDYAVSAVLDRNFYEHLFQKKLNSEDGSWLAISNPFLQLRKLSDAVSCLNRWDFLCSFLHKRLGVDTLGRWSNLTKYFSDGLKPQTDYDELLMFCLPSLFFLIFFPGSTLVVCRTGCAKEESLHSPGANEFGSWRIGDRQDGTRYVSQQSRCSLSTMGKPWTSTEPYS